MSKLAWAALALVLLAIAGVLLLLIDARNVDRWRYLKAQRRGHRGEWRER
jgi:hypothetical protein